MLKIWKFARSTARGARLFAAAATIALSGGIASAAVVFDNASLSELPTPGETVSSTSSTPNTFMGDGYTLAPGTSDITGFDLYPVNVTGTNYTALKLTVYVWGTVNTGTVSASAPAFSNLLNSYTLTSTGTYTSGFYYNFESATPGVTPGISLASPLTVPGTTIGITLAYQGSTDGVNFASANSLTSIIKYGTAAVPTVGSESFNGYYRNANSEVNGNFTSTLRSLGQTNQSLMLRVYGDVVPEPTSMAVIGMTFVGLTARRRRTA